MISIGTRGSPLARWQAERVKSLLAAKGAVCEIIILKSAGDVSPDAPIASIGVGVFTKELEDALLARSIDVAVHSLKDLPSAIAPGLALAAVPEREDPRDAVVGRKLADLPAGARVATSSPRRQEWLRLAFPKLVAVPVRGNVDTRIRKLDAGEFEGLLMAAAGLNRLGLGRRIAELLPLDSAIPPAGQGALAVETRAGEEGLVGGIDALPIRAAVECERLLFKLLGAGCRTPLGAFAEPVAGGLRLRADLAGLREEATGADGGNLARETASQLLAKGAARVIAAWR